jgi:translation initiation factor IF-3
VNHEIRVREVRVIGAEGEQLGVMPARDALTKAQESGLDLVEIAPTANPPVCRIMDFGKYKYEQSKKQHSMKVHQRGGHLKEVKFRPHTDKHDLEFKIKNIRKFLSEGNKAKITVMFRGREMAYIDQGRQLMAKVIEQVGDGGVVEQHPRLEGLNMIMIFAPKSAKSGGAASVGG